MQLSRYTFYVPREGSDELLVLNYLTGAIDLIESDQKEEFLRRFDTNLWDGYGLTDYMLDRGYLVESKEKEEEIIQAKYFEFQEEYDRTPVQLIFSMTYSCNFSCSYCFQEEYLHNSGGLGREITDAFFRHVDRKFGEETVRPYVTLFGGEPLLGGENHRDNLLYFLEQAKQHNVGIAIVTNGYELESYVPDLIKTGAAIKEIQVTLDGDREMHNRRRKTKAGEPTFDRIAAGIDLALQKGLRINLRTIVDRENLASLPALARFAIDRGWLNYPQELFETQLGRNYELHTCQKTDHLYSRVEMWQDYLELSRKYPVLRSYTKPQFHGMRYLQEYGELPAPIFDGCPAGKKEWAFDLKGDIYGCTASVGVERFRLGSFLDENQVDNEDQILEWETRDVLTIDECSTCPVSLSCGGGCGVLAANQNDGRIHSPDCRPVKELVGVGASYYNIGSGDQGD